MAQNLNYQTGNSWCYNNDNSNCEKYGRLYDWETAKTACLKGSHLPTGKEWKTLALVADNGWGSARDGVVSEMAGKILKSVYGWDGKGNGTDEFGFSALPSGMRGDGRFEGDGDWSGWWTASTVWTPYKDQPPYSIEIGTGDEVYGRGKSSSYGYSVRCVAD